MNNKNILNEIYSMFARLGMGEVKPELYEGKLGKYENGPGRRSVRYMESQGITDLSQQLQILDTLTHNLQITRTSDPKYKFLPGIVRLFLNRELDNANQIHSLTMVLGYVTDAGHQGQYDEMFNNLSLNELTQRFQSLKQEDDQKSKDNVAQLGYGEQSTNGYEIVPINSEEQCEEYYEYNGGLEGSFWCITQGSFSGYGLDEENQCYFCLKQGFENLQAPTEPENAPFDEFGLSMISVIVGYDGMPKYITTRWNHNYNGENNPELRTPEQVSKVIGVDFFKVFQPNEKGLELQRKFRECQQMLDSGMESEEVFDEVEELESGVLLVQIGNLCNLVKDRRVLCKQWFDYIEDFYDGLARVQNSDYKWSYIDRDGKFIDGGGTTNLWFDDCYNFKDGLAMVENSENKVTFLRTDGKFIDGGDTTNLWFDNINDFYDGLARVQNSDYKWSYIDRDGKFIDGGGTTNLWFDDCYDFYNGFGRVQNSEGKWTFLREDGKFIDGGDTTNLWFDCCDIFRDGFAKVLKSDNKCTFIRTDGKFIDGGDTTNLWFRFCCNFHNGFARVENSKGEQLFIDQEGNLYDNDKNPITQVTEARIDRIIRKVLNETIDGAFSYEELSSLRSYTQRIRYCKEHLGKHIGNGSSRTVFQIDDEKCLKLAKNEKGIAQNEAEYDWGAQNYGVMPKLYDADDDYSWIVVECVTPAKKDDFKKYVGVDWNTFCSFVIACYADYSRKPIPTLMKRDKMNELSEKYRWLGNLRRYMADYQPPYGDLIALRNYGKTIRDGNMEIVILDSGLSQSVWEQYYCRR